jgi:large subunit ribosomal protein L13
MSVEPKTVAKRVIKTHVLDADGKVLGRLATQIAVLLRGKDKVGFTFNQDHGDLVIVHNPEKIVVTGNKREDKQYYRHSSYPGSLKQTNFASLQAKHPDRIISLAVRNMLPKNRLRNIWMKRLIIETAKENGQK